MSLKIFAHTAGPDIKGAAHLEYRGYIISMSNIPWHPEIGIWLANSTSGHMHIIYDVSMDAILEAKAYVDNIVDAAPKCGLCNQPLSECYPACKATYS
jgi:hypothetical protein